MTKDEQQYLEDLKRLDDISLGMVLPSIKVREPMQVRDRLMARKWIHTRGQKVFGEPVVFLSTRGLRALRRASS